MTNATTPAKRNVIDWDAVERDYRAGVLSTREIGAAHGVSHTAVNKRAKTDGWTRDLSAQIRAKAEAKVARLAVSSEVSAQKVATEREVIEANATQIARIRGEHRIDIQRSKRIANRLLETLERLEITEAPSRRGAMDAESESEAGGTASLKEQAALLRTLVETQRTLVGMEREAYGIAKMVDDPDDGAQAVEPLLATARRIAFVLASAGSLIKKG